jgi:hypothetical protein
MTDGFFVGKNQKGLDIYVGRGTFNGDLAPGNIQPGGAAGFYMVTNFAERYVTSGATYLVVPPTCKCTWISKMAAVNATGMARVGQYFIGRYTFANGAKTIGKVFGSINPDSMNYADNGAEPNTQAFDALQCLVA